MTSYSISLSLSGQIYMHTHTYPQEYSKEETKINCDIKFVHKLRITAERKENFFFLLSLHENVNLRNHHQFAKIVYHVHHGSVSSCNFQQFFFFFFVIRKIFLVNIVLFLLLPLSSSSGISGEFRDKSRRRREKIDKIDWMIFCGWILFFSLPRRWFLVINELLIWLNLFGLVLVRFLYKRGLVLCLYFCESGI